MVQSILEDLVATTNALCATCRVVVGLGPSLGSRSLARIAYAGDPSVVASPDEIEIGELPTSSVNAWVARTGNACYLQNIPSDHGRSDGDSSDEFTWDTGFSGLDGTTIYRRGILCELCVPVCADGRVVATINLESMSRDAFTRSAYAIEECAQLVGLAFMFARREISTEMLDAAGGFLDQRHTFEGHLMSGIKGVGLLSGVLTRPHDVEIFDDVFDHLRSARAILWRSTNAPSAQREQSRSIKAVIERAFRDTSELFGLDADLDDVLIGIHPRALPLIGLSLPSRAELAFGFALRQVFQNAFRHGISDGTYSHRRPDDWHHDVAVEFGQTVLGGVPSLVVGVLNCVWRDRADSRHVSRIFREPIETERFALGAFLAGEALRRAGGAASLRIGREISDDVLAVEAELSVPVVDGA